MQMKRSVVSYAADFKQTTMQLSIREEHND
jgi:hypothetical protein